LLSQEDAVSDASAEANHEKALELILLVKRWQSRLNSRKRARKRILFIFYLATWLDNYNFVKKHKSRPTFEISRELLELSKDNFGLHWTKVTDGNPLAYLLAERLIDYTHETALRRYFITAKGDRKVHRMIREMQYPYNLEPVVVTPFILRWLYSMAVVESLGNLLERRATPEVFQGIGRDAAHDVDSQKLDELAAQTKRRQNYVDTMVRLLGSKAKFRYLAIPGMSGFVTFDKFRLRVMDVKGAEKNYGFMNENNEYIMVAPTEAHDKLNLPVMHGFLTTPFYHELKILAYFDHGNKKDWMGGSNTFLGHQGTDIVAEPGDVVRAAAPGLVKYVDDLGDEEFAMVITHEKFANEVLSTYYSHLKDVLVKEGQMVDRGEKIASVGSNRSKPALGPYLHFELDAGYHSSPTRQSDYRPIDVFRPIWDPNAFGYWTEENRPH
jgi:murein DD-endopeptidase MepM/ murein hydrolase activator NlpD